MCKMTNHAMLSRPSHYVTKAIDLELRLPVVKHSVIDLMKKHS